uniref:Uncharacterized protein n=1 Tax=Glossina austeni TaxID=7395 RepID=A0A1A9VSS8_GLOAU
MKDVFNILANKHPMAAAAIVSSFYFCLTILLLIGLPDLSTILTTLGHVTSSFLSQHTRPEINFPSLCHKWPITYYKEQLWLSQCKLTLVTACAWETTYRISSQRGRHLQRADSGHSAFSKHSIPLTSQMFFFGPTAK